MDESKRAVIIGVNQYRDEAIPKLQGSENDARELYARLINKESAGFEIDEKKHFLLGEKATCQAIREAISDLFWETDPCGLSLFYFSGHGFRDSYGNGYMAPYDIERDAPFVCGIRMQELTDLLQKTVAKERILVVLDCCYSGIAAAGTKDAGMAADMPPVDEWVRVLEGEDTGKGKIIFASSGKDKTSKEMWLDPAAPGSPTHTFNFDSQTPTRHCHGVFTFHLLEGLDGKAATKGGDAITVEGLRKYVSGQMGDDPPWFLGGGRTDEDKIIVARASQWRTIDTKLENAKEWKDGRPKSVFRAVNALGEVIKRCTNLESAVTVKGEIDAKLKIYRGPAGAWLVKNSLKIDQQLDDLVDSLRGLTPGLSVDTILQQDGWTQSLLMNLCEVSCRKPGSDDTYITTADFLEALDARLSESRQGTSVLPPAQQNVAPAGISVSGSERGSGG